VKIDFKIDTEYGEYSDALYFPDDAVPDEIEIENIKKERVDRWVKIVKDMREQGSNNATLLPN
jgi:hypothetical protein